MKVIAAILIFSALVIGIVPQFTDCLAQGRAIQLASGRSLPMACHWTRQAAIAVALPLLAVGGLMLVARRWESLRILSALASVLGLSAVLLPTALIGVCANPQMICNMVLRPTLLFAGVLTMGAGLLGLIYLRGAEQTLATAAVPERVR